MIAVRRADPQRYPEIRRLLRAAYGRYAADVAEEVFPVYLADVLDLDGAAVLVALDGDALDGDALDGDALVGTARLHLRPDGLGLPAGAAYVPGVAVRPDREGGGIASTLMRSCADRARAAGATSVHLHTTSVMTRAIGLYERLGYRRTPAHDTNSAEHYGPAVEPPLHALAYRLELAVQSR